MRVSNIDIAVVSAALIAIMLDCGCSRKHLEFLLLRFNATGQSIYLRDERSTENLVFKGDSLKHHFVADERTVVVEGTGEIRWHTNFVRAEVDIIVLNNKILPKVHTSYVLSRDGQLIAGFLRDFD